MFLFELIICVIRYVQHGRKPGIHPTPGLKLHQFKRLSTQWNIFDMSGHGKYRYMWEDFYQSVQVGKK